MANILVIRLSAIGDVAMTLPVIYNAARSNPSDTFTVLTQAFLIPIFMNRPSNVQVLGINTKGPEKTLGGLLRFATVLMRYDYSLVLDLHDVIRTKILRSFFKAKGVRVIVYKKDRRARKLLTAQDHKVFKPLDSVISRYAETFRKAGLNYTENFTSLYQENMPDLSFLHSLAEEKKEKWIGFAPFAKHMGKMYPLDQMEKVVEALSNKEGYTLFLFGGRGKEEAVLDKWTKKYPHVKSAVGKYSLDQELALISQLDLLVSMDSANMHFASLVGTRVLSIWGATHPYAGFYGFGQDPSFIVQIDLVCRPCSVFGDKPCSRGDWACMKQITPKQILAKIEEIVGS